MLAICVQRNQFFSGKSWTAGNSCPRRRGPESWGRNRSTK